MVRALLYLRLESLRNLVVHRVSRLRQPKYLVGAAAAAAYFYYFVFRYMRAAGFGGYREPGAQGFGPLAAGLACAVLCAMALIRIAYAWSAPVDNPGLAFSEAEIAFLFPAPLSRRSLIHFRLLSSQFAILFSAVIITLVFNRAASLGGSRVLHAIGWWVILSMIDLHLNGTRLTLARLKQRGSRMLAWRAGAVTLIAAYAVAVIWAAQAPLASFETGSFGSLAGTGRLLGAVEGSPAFRWLTLPFRIVVGPYFSAGYAEFAEAMLPALALLGLHYFWVSRSEASFEEGSIVFAEKRAAIRAAMSRGEMPGSRSKPKPSPGPFPLAAKGPPEIAFLWKNLLSLRSSLFSRRSLIMLIGVALWVCIVVRKIAVGRAAAGREGALGLVVLILCAIAAGYTIILGPQIARQDLRNDLPNADMLKTYPIEGWRLALGELLAPTAILTAILWFTIIAASSAAGGPDGFEWLTPAVRTTAVVCLGLVSPLLCLIQLIVPNTAMVLMPAWYQASRSRTMGVEMFGQRLVFGLMQMVLALIVFLPAAGAAALVFFASAWVLGISAAIILATLATVFMMAGEAAIGLWFLGERIEHFDPSSEPR